MRRHARCVETSRAHVRQVARDRLLAVHQFKQAAQQGQRKLPEAARLSLPEGRGDTMREMRRVIMPGENPKTSSGAQDSTSWFFGDGDNRIFGKSKGQSFEVCVSEGKSKRVPVEQIPFKCRKLYANTYVGDCYVCPQLGDRCFVPKLIHCKINENYCGVDCHTYATDFPIARARIPPLRIGNEVVAATDKEWQVDVRVCYDKNENAFFGVRWDGLKGHPDVFEAHIPLVVWNNIVANNVQGSVIILKEAWMTFYHRDGEIPQGYVTDCSTIMLAQPLYGPTRQFAWASPLPTEHELRKQYEIRCEQKRLRDEREYERMMVSSWSDYSCPKASAEELGQEHPYEGC